MSAFASEAIETWGLEELRSFLHEAQEIVAVIVAEDKNDVLLFSNGWPSDEEKESEERKEFWNFHVKSKARDKVVVTQFVKTPS